MEQILLAYDLPKETVPAKMMIYKNTKAIVLPLDGNTDFFDIFIGAVKGDTLAVSLLCSA